MPDLFSELWTACDRNTWVIASVLTVANLAVIWVGVARWHWFLRLVVLAAFGWAVIAARVYEGAAFLAVQGVSTFLLLAAFRRGRQPATPRNPANSAPPGTTRWRARFHLSDVLLANVVLAGFLAELTYAAGQPGACQWSIVLTSGFAAGLLASAAVWLAWGQSRWLIRTLASSVTVLISFGVAYWADPMRSQFWTDPVSIVIRVGVATLANASLLTMALFLFRVAFPARISTAAGQSRASGKWTTRLAQGGLVALAIGIVIPTAALAWVLLGPLPQPEPPHPGPNAYQEVLQIVNSISTTTIPDASMAPAKALQAYAQQQQRTAAQLHATLLRPCCVPLDWTPGAKVISINNLQALRNASRFLSACGHGELSAGRVSQAAEHFVDNMRLAHRTAHGGLLIDWLVGVAIEGVGIHDLAPIRHQLALEQISDVRRTLLALEADREPWDVVQRRDRNWTRLAFGWRGKLETTLEQPLSSWFTPGPSPRSEPSYSVEIGRLARFALLLTEFALREYILEHGRSPESLNELVPRYLPAVPSDPFSDRPLVYRRQADGHLLYSVGANGTDDGGVAAEWSDMLQGHGDLFLDGPPTKADTSGVSNQSAAPEK